jgi:hypothetical protein
MRGSTFRVSAAAAAVLFLSGCGTVSAGSSSGVGEPPVLHVGLDGSQGMDAAKLSSGSGSGSGAYRVEGVLPDTPSHASTYRVAPADGTSVRRVAAALGLSATPRRHAHGWVVTSGGNELRMRDTGQWSLQRLADPCPPYQIDVDSPDGSVGVACATVGVGVVRPKAAGAPAGGQSAPALSGDHLRKVAYPLLSALGLDPTPAAVTVATSTVSVNPVVAGLPTTGYDSEVVIDTAGIRAATGWAYPGKPAKGDTYPLVRARDALKLFGSGPRPMMGAPAIACPVSTRSPSAMPLSCGGTLVVNGGRLGLELRWDGGPIGHPILVPAWFLAVRGSDSPLVLVAVDPKYLAEPGMPTTEPNPADSPSAVPGSTGGGSAGSGSAGPPGSTGGTQVPVPKPPSGTLPLSSYTVSADGRTLKLTGWGSACEHYGPAPAGETVRAITVGIVVTSTQPSDMACDDIAKQITVPVELATRLGTRAVIDRSTGAKVPPG